jgi:hypothetical protein
MKWVDFDAHFWSSVTPLAKSGFDPKALPFTLRGTIRLVSSERAVFTRGHARLDLRRASEPRLAYSHSCF